MPEKASINIDGKEWFLAVTRNMSFWHQCLLVPGWYHHSQDFGVHFNLDIVSLTESGTHTQCFIYHPNFDQYLVELAKVFSTKDSVDALIKIYKNLELKLLSSLDAVLKELNEKNLAAFFDAYEKYTPGLMVTTAFSKSGTDALIKRLQELGFLETKIEDIIAEVTYPSEHTPLFNSQIDLMKIASEIQSKTLAEPELTARLSEWIGKYGNIPVNYCDEPWSMENAEAQLKSMLQKNAAQELARTTDSHTEHLRKGKEYLDQIKDQTVENLAYALSEGTYINESRKNVFSTVSLRYRPIFIELAKMGGSTKWQDCFYLMPQEMLCLARGEKVDIKSIVGERQVAGIKVGENGCIELLSKPVVQELLEYSHNLHGKSKDTPKDASSDQTKQTIKGFSACKGKVTGIVRIIMNSKDFDRLNTGEILVTAMTSVDFVPVMEKASAFVTNEGGIMCHAAIVSREMQKPCIIGTKIATKVLHDGDLVEVDADKGVVRIMK